MSNPTTLSNEAYLDQMFNAVTSGDATALDRLVSSQVSLQEDNDNEPDVVAEVTTDTATSTPNEEVPTTPESEKDWRQELPEEVRAKVISDFEALNNQRIALEKYRSSNEGRVSGLQKKINTLESQLTNLQTPRPQPVAAPVSKEETDDPLMQELKENDPALYAALRKREEHMTATFSGKLQEIEHNFSTQLQNNLTPLRQKAAQDETAHQASLVEQAVPYVREMVVSEEWKHFMEVAPESVRAQANSAVADDFLAAVDMFAVWAFRTYGDNAQQRTSPAATTLSTTQPSASTALAESRARKVGAVAPTSRAAPVPRQEELDEDTLLEQMFLDIRAKAGYK